MTIEINVPIKCSTVKGIKKQVKSVLDKIKSFMCYLTLPLGIFFMGLSIYLSIDRIHPKSIEISFIVFMLGFFGSFFGTILWHVSPPFKIKCISDEAIGND